MLNTQQQEALTEVLYGDSQIVLLLGEAGTGKSFTTVEIIRAYPGSVAVTATTNRAKEVLANMSKQPANTIHSQLGFNLLRSGKEQYLSKVRPSSVADLVIVEEISMISRQVYKQLMEEVAEGSIKKLLLLGDPIQLPSVGIGIDLDKVDATRIELTQQMRQQPNPELRNYLMSFRKAIETKSEDFVPYTSIDGAIIFTDSFRDFTKAYHETEGVKKVLAFSNSVVDKYNEHIHGDIFRIGDELVINKPLGRCKNGDTIEVLDFKEETDRYLLDVIASGDLLSVYQYKTKTAMERDAEAYMEFYWDFLDTCYDLKHQYACTVHKSQGSTYDHVFVDGTDLWAQVTRKRTPYQRSEPMSYNTFLRLLYVAITRMKYSATIFVGEKRNYKLLRK